MGIVLSDAPPTEWTIADVQARLAGFPADRIRVYPTPGTATEQDVLDAEARSNRICELIDGTLVEKTMASLESALAAALIHFLYLYADTRTLGMVLAPDGMLKILSGQIRVPDVSFIRWERFPGRRPFKTPIFPVAPDLAVEILSKNNTAEEMDRKLHDYFTAGVRLVWYIEPATRTARAYTGVDQWSEVGVGDSLVGGEVLPGFALPLGQLFDWVDAPREG
jgi:Uma2 family endonuclease